MSWSATETAAAPRRMELVGPAGGGGCATAPGHADGGAEAGFALVFVLLGMLVALGIASAAVAGAVGQVRAAAAAGRVVEARAAARAGIESALASTRGASAAVAGDSAVRLAAGVFSTGVAWSVASVRVSAELHLLIGEAAVDALPPWREGRVAWWMDPATRVAGHGAVVESPAVTPGATIEADSLLAARAGMTGCAREAAIAQAFGGGVPLRRAAPGPPEWGGRPGSGYEAVRLGWFGASQLLAMADRAEPGIAPPPGMPPGGPSWQGLVAGRGNVVVSGAGAGVLVVDGDLTLNSGGSWTGLVLVSGSVALLDSSRLLGLLRTGGAVTVAPGAVVDGSPCAALASLSNAPALRRPVSLPRRSGAGPLLPGAP